MLARKQAFCSSRENELRIFFLDELAASSTQLKCKLYIRVLCVLHFWDRSGGHETRVMRFERMRRAGGGWHCLDNLRPHLRRQYKIQVASMCESNLYNHNKISSAAI